MIRLDAPPYAMDKKLPKRMSSAVWRPRSAGSITLRPRLAAGLPLSNTKQTRQCCLA